MIHTNLADPPVKLRPCCGNFPLMLWSTAPLDEKQDTQMQTTTDREQENVVLRYTSFKLRGFLFVRNCAEQDAYADLDSESVVEDRHHRETITINSAVGILD